MISVKTQNIRYLGKYIQDNFDDIEKVNDASLVLEQVRQHKKKKMTISTMCTKKSLK